PRPGPVRRGAGGSRRGGGRPGVDRLGGGARCAPLVDDRRRRRAERGYPAPRCRAGRADARRGLPAADGCRGRGVGGPEMPVPAVLAPPGVSGSIGRRQVLALAALEARRYARRWSIWVGWAATIAVASFSHPDWAGGSYEQVVPVSFSGLVLGTYVAAVRT